MRNKTTAPAHESTSLNYNGDYLNAVGDDGATTAEADAVVSKDILKEPTDTKTPVITEEQKKQITVRLGEWVIGKFEKGFNKKPSNAMINGISVSLNSGNWLIKWMSGISKAPAENASRFFENFNTAMQSLPSPDVNQDESKNDLVRNYLFLLVLFVVKRNGEPEAFWMPIAVKYLKTNMPGSYDQLLTEIVKPILDTNKGGGTGGGTGGGNVSAPIILTTKVEGGSGKVVVTPAKKSYKANDYITIKTTPSTGQILASVQTTGSKLRTGINKFRIQLKGGGAQEIKVYFKQIIGGGGDTGGGDTGGGNTGGGSIDDIKNDDNYSVGGLSTASVGIYAAIIVGLVFFGGVKGGTTKGRL